MPDNPQNPHRPNRRQDSRQGPSQLDAPWRLKYIEAIGNVQEQQDADKAKRKSRPDTGCFIRDYWLTPEDDIENHVIERTDQGMIFLNRYPYANGHLLVALGESRSRFLDYSANQRAALWALVDRANDLMEDTLEPHGINIGVNQGRAAGAGIPQHLHVHLVPRWEGDVNFITTVGDIRVIPGSLDAMAERYRRSAAEESSG
ncbi:MAG: HIT domain-containing protein [Phycisphaera sp.]|nr:MAG: HIT domain-containing protein [Phycisphaera sp.]